VEVVPIARTNSAIIASVEDNLGARIRLTCSGIPTGGATQAQVLLWFEDIWNALHGRLFKFFLFNDRAWVDCALESQEESIGLEPLIAVQDLQLSIVCPNAAPSTSYQVTFTNYASEYPFASLVGTPACDAVTPGGGITPVSEPSQQVYSGVFPGVLSTISTAGQEHQFTIGGTAGSVWRITGFQVTGSTSLGSEVTTLSLSATGVGGIGEFVEAELDGTLVSAAGEDYFDVEAGETVYVFCTGAGSANDLQYAFHAIAQ
jgi:hypothetical protein